MLPNHNANDTISDFTTYICTFYIQAITYTYFIAYYLYFITTARVAALSYCTFYLASYAHYCYPYAYYHRCHACYRTASCTYPSLLHHRGPSLLPLHSIPFHPTVYLTVLFDLSHSHLSLPYIEKPCKVIKPFTA